MSAFKVLFVLFEINLVFSTLPAVEKCRLSDNACLKQSSQNVLTHFTAGIPEYNTEVLDPMAVDLIAFELAGLKLSVTDSTVKGLKASVIDKLSFNTEKKQMNLAFHVDNVSVKGKYKASGRLLILPISGDGDVVFKIKKLYLDFVIPYELAQNANGRGIIEFKSYKFNFDVRENLRIQLTNLFNGNKQLSDIMHSFMNDNWKQISEEFGRPIIEQVFTRVFKSIKTYFKEQPLDEITIT